MSGFQTIRVTAATGPTAADIYNSTYTYAADAEANDSYAITITDGPTAYASGMTLAFKANTANTGAATLNVNSIGAITIKKLNDQDLETGDIESGQVVVVTYDGTNFQMQSQSAQLLDSTDVGVTVQGVLAEGAFVDGDKTKLDGIETAADVTDATNVVASLNGATITSATVATGDKVLVQDADDSDNLKTVTAQSIADLASGGSETAVDSAENGTWFNYVIPCTSVDAWVFVNGGTSTVRGGYLFVQDNGGNGMQGYVTIPGTGTSETYASATEIKIKFYARAGGFAAKFGISANGNVGDTGQELMRVDIDGASSQFVTSTGASPTQTGTTATLSVGTWYELMMHLRPGTDARLYVNGTLDTTITTTLPNGAMSRVGFITEGNASAYAYIGPITVSMKLS